MVMKKNDFVQLTFFEAAETPWDTFAVERLDVVWHKF